MWPLAFGVIKPLPRVREPPYQCTPFPGARPPAWGRPGDDWSVGRPVGTPEPLIVTGLPQLFMPLSSACDRNAALNKAFGHIPGSHICPPPPQPPSPVRTEAGGEGFADVNRGIYSYVPWPGLCRNICGDSSSREGELPVSSCEPAGEAVGPRVLASEPPHQDRLISGVCPYRLISKSEDRDCGTRREMPHSYTLSPRPRGQGPQPGDRPPGALGWWGRCGQAGQIPGSEPGQCWPVTVPAAQARLSTLCLAVVITKPEGHRPQGALSPLCLDVGTFVSNQAGSEAPPLPRPPPPGPASLPVLTALLSASRMPMGSRLWAQAQHSSDHKARSEQDKTQRPGCPLIHGPPRPAQRAHQPSTTGGPGAQLPAMSTPSPRV